jgi:N-acetylglutamate synthase-like GNAT family acetyltransferase
MKGDMKFKFIKSQDPEYGAERMLRWEVLRKPLGMPPGSEALEQDTTSLHLIALQDKKLIGCVCFLPETKTQGRIYQMAVSQEYRGKGFGRRLISTLEEALAKQGFKDLYLYAESDTQGFYSRMGYHREGDPIQQMGDLQCVMRKTLFL